MSTPGPTPAAPDDGGQGQPRGGDTPSGAAGSQASAPPAVRRQADAALGPSPVFFDAMAVQQQQQRASLSSMLFLTFFFFMMSGGNGGNNDMMVGDMRPHEQDFLQVAVNDYVNYLNHTASNYSFPPEPDPPMATLLPPHLLAVEHASLPPVYFHNITGFYRNADAHYLNLTHPGSSPSVRHFFRHLSTRGSRDEQELAHEHTESRSQTEDDELDLPPLLHHLSSFNETTAAAARGEWDWSNVVSWEMNLEERAIIPQKTEAHPPIDPTTSVNASDWEDWSWVFCTMSFLTSERESLSYRLQGLHHKPTGSYRLLGKPRELGYDLRDLPMMFDEDDRHDVAQMVLWQLQKRLQVLLDSMFYTEHEEDDPFPLTTCTMHLDLRLRALPAEYTEEMLKQYEDELRDPTGVALKPPPAGIALEGVALLDECGLAFGLDQGNGLEADEFWRKSIHYAAFALAANLLILVLFVRQMEATRTPSSLAKVSFWTITMMISADSWQFSAHVVIGIMSDDKTSLPMLLPGFVCLCTAIIFGPRFAVLLYRVQAPETTPRRLPDRQRANGETTPLTTDGEASGSGGPAERQSTLRAIWASVREEADSHPQGKWLLIGALILAVLYFGLIPQIVPIFLGVLYSFWLPQIWRNARRGTRKALNWSFVLGSSAARLALPLYAFACPENVFFVETTDWIWLLVAWQWFQVMILIAQDRFNPSFFLPKRFAPPEAYDYHPILPANDSESQMQQFGDCSICMEPIVVHLQPDQHGASGKASGGPGSSTVGAVGSKVLSMQMRRTYALAPCHHMFHTACLSQWLAVKNICPLCKRTLPPL